MTYTEVVVALAVAIPLAGVATEFLLRQYRLRGYGDIAGEAAAIGRAIRGEIDRDSGDLLVRGTMSSSPVLVRFSHSDQRPGLNIQVPAAGNVSLFCVPRGHESGGRARLSSSDPRFDSRFRLSSNHPALANILFCTPATLAEIQKLCRTSHTFLALDQQRLEITELLIPEENLSQLVLDCIQAMIGIASASRQMPGAEPQPVVHFPRRWNWFRTAYIGAPVLLLSSILLFARLQRPVDVPQPLPASLGMAEDEASQIPDVQHWRLAQAADFDGDAAAWLQQQGQKANGYIGASLTDNDREDSAYVLKHIAASPGDPSRLVVFVQGQVRFDATMPIAIVARIPKDKVKSIEWLGRGPAGQPDGDGILVIQRYQDNSSGIVFFSSGVQFLSGHPRDFHTVSAR